MAATDNAAEQVAHIAEKIRAGKTTLGIEFGSTRIKAVLIDDNFQTIASGDYSWASHLEDGLWSYTTEEIWGRFAVRLRLHGQRRRDRLWREAHARRPHRLLRP